MGLVEIFRSRLKQSKNSMLISMNLCFGVFVFFWIYVWKEIVFLKGLVKFREITNIEDLIKS